MKQRAKRRIVPFVIFMYLTLCLSTAILHLDRHIALAAATLLSQKDDVDVSPNVSRFDSFQTTKQGTIRVVLTGSGVCRAALYYAGADEDSSISSQDGKFLEEKTITLSSSTQSFTAPALQKGVYNLVLSTPGEDTIVCNTKVYFTTDKSTFSLDKKKLALKKGQAVQLEASCADGQVAWSTSNNKAVKVDQAGKVTAVGAGKAVITAKCGTKKAKCRVTVAGDGLKLNITKATVTQGADMQLEVKGGTGAIQWQSNNIEVAQVSSEGVVTGVSQGTATISAVHEGGAMKCQVTVED